MIEERFELEQDGVSTLHHYLRALWRRKWVGLAPLVVIPLVTLVATARQQALHEASADVLVNRQEAATTSLIGQTPALDDAGRTMETQVRLARVPLLAERVLTATSLTGRSARALLARSTVFPLADILRFTVTDEDPALAARLASEYARQFVRYRRELDTAGLARALEELRRQITQLEKTGRVDSPLYVRLADREQQLVALEALRTSNVSVVQTAAAADATQVAPRPLRNTALALAAGLVVGLVVVFLWETLSTKPRSQVEIAALLGMPFLGRLRLDSRAAGAVSSPLLADPGGAEVDAFHALRTNLELANAGIGARAIMVTSLHGGEGKSATVASLGVVFARAGRRVALVDLDLREPSLTRLFGLDNRLGATTLARGECELADALVAVPVEDADERGPAAGANEGPGDVGTLAIVAAGPLPTHPAKTLCSSALAAALSDLGRRADIVLVDVPPLLDAPDAAAVSALLDGLLLVVSSRRTRRPALAEARRAVDAWPLARLGFALTEGADGRPHVRALHRSTRQARTRVARPERAT